MEALTLTHHQTNHFERPNFEMVFHEASVCGYFLHGPFTTSPVSVIDMQKTFKKVFYLSLCLCETRKKKKTYENRKQKSW